MSEPRPDVCPTCGQPTAADALDAVGESVDALFDDLSSFPVRIDLDRELDPEPAIIAVPAETVGELEEAMLRVAQVLTVLRGTVDESALDLLTLVDAVSADAAAWARRLDELRRG